MYEVSHKQKHGILYYIVKIKRKKMSLSQWDLNYVNLIKLNLTVTLTQIKHPY